TALEPIRPNATRLETRLAEMAALGSHLAGSKAHKSFVDSLEQYANQYREARVYRETQTFDYWAPTNVKLLIDEVPIEVSSVYFDSPTGVLKGTLANAGHFLFPNYQNLRGRIAVVDVPFSEIEFKALSENARIVKDAKGSFSDQKYRRAWQGLLVPTMEKFADAGAVGVIFVLDTPQEDAFGQHYFGKGPQTIPGIFVSKEQRKQILDGKTARMIIRAESYQNTSDHLIVELPGESEESILLASHTDGPNVIEENGPLGLLELLSYFSRQPRACRPKTLRFLFATGHMDENLQSVGGWLHGHPEIADHTLAVLVMEHLGAMEWEVRDGVLQSTGRNEPGLAFVSSNHHSFSKLVEKALLSSSLDRAVLLPKFGAQSIFIGEGIEANAMGIPTFGWVPSPTYLLASAANSHSDKVSVPLMRKEIALFADLVRELVENFHALSRAKEVRYAYRNKTYPALFKHNPTEPQRPLFVWINGTNFSNNDELSEMMLDSMVEKGFNALSVGYANGYLDGFLCEDLARKAEAIFVGTDSAISTAYRELNLPEPASIVVSGFSQGAWIGGLSRNYSAKIERALLLAVGDSPTFGALPCLTRMASERFKVRAVNGQSDGVFEDNFKNLASVTGYWPREFTFDALDSNGSGWLMVPDVALPQGRADHGYMLAEEGNSGRPHPLWMQTELPWGMKAGLNWLATAD
ncbi:MAG: hypothetical protein KDD39_06890, partial [Bdellovibrionales bacterium]|nr:hypothetical protein [Bdellovibrionales bacterium]